MMGRFLSDELTLLNNEPRRWSNPVTAASLRFLQEACCRRVMSERIVRGSIEVISCPTTERKRSRAPWSLKYPSRTSLYSSSNRSCHGDLYLAPEDVL